jgi:methylmalonyl-CoA mutase N-terminal domain/subunit
VGVKRGGPNIGMPQQFLHRADVVPRLQQLGRKAMAKGVAARRLREVHFQRIQDRSRQNRHAILGTFRVPNNDLLPPQDQVLDAKPQRLHQAQAAAIEQVGHQPHRAFDLLEPTISLAHNYGLTDQRIRAAQLLVEAHADEIRSAWRKHFAS